MQRYILSRSGNPVSEETLVQLFMMSYHHAREDRMPPQEAHNSALGFIRQSFPKFPESLVPLTMCP